MAQPVAQPPTTTPTLEKGGLFTAPWIQWFTTIWTSIKAPANTIAPPASSIATGTGGQIAFDQNFAYFCVGKNQWKRVPLQNF